MFLKYPFLFIVCFYYAILTPKAADYETNMESYLFEVVFMSIIQGLVMWGLIAYFELEWTLQNLVIQMTGYGPSVFEFCLAASGWTLLGGLQFPYLNESLKEEEAKRNRERRRERFAHTFAKLDADLSKQRQKKRDEEIDKWDRSVEKNGFEKSIATLKRQLRHLENGRKPFGDLEIFTDAEWLRKEIKPLETMNNCGKPDDSFEHEREKEISQWNAMVDKHGAEKCIKTLERQLRLFELGRNNGNNYRILKDPHWMRQEIDRLKSTHALTEKIFLNL